MIAVTAFAMKGDEERIRAGRVRSLHLQADLGGQVPGDGAPFLGDPTSQGAHVPHSSSADDIAVSDRTIRNVLR